MTWEAVRTPDERFDALADYPFQPRYVEIDGLRIHYVDEGGGPPVVLFHGEPTWAFLYRKIIPALGSAGYRAIAPDYPGFGRSDKPTDPAFYTYDRLCGFMVELVDQLDVIDATAVVQDWGGPIGLRAAVERPERFTRLVILNTGLFSGRMRPNRAFDAWRSFVERTPDLPVGTIMQNAAAGSWPHEVLAGYEAPFPDAAYKVGAQQLPLIVPRSPTDEGAARMGEVRAAVDRWGGPVLVMFSDSDPIFPPQVGRRWAERIAGAETFEVIEGAGHFLQEDRGELVAERIVAFLDRTSGR